MAQEYIEQRGNGYYFMGSRVSLDSVVYEFLKGEPPEGIAQSFPSLSLEQVYGSITFYLAHRAEIDAYLERGEAVSRNWHERHVRPTQFCTPNWKLRSEDIHPTLMCPYLVQSGDV